MVAELHTELDLKALNLVGTISPHIGNLLYLHDNHFASNIPNHLGRLRQLQLLNLSGNLLTGTIPPAFTNCTSLMTIDLSGNAISGGIPASIHLLRKLRI